MILTLPSRQMLEFLQGDITRQEVDAIVNAANSTLMGGGGVDGAIHRAGGPAILAECHTIVARRGQLPPGKAVATTGGNLRARHVIHTVGPIWGGGDRGEASVLASCYRECLRIAHELSLRHIAFPSISTGAYGYPVHEAAEVAVTAVADILPEAAGLITARFVLFDRHTLDVYCNAARSLFPALAARD